MSQRPTLRAVLKALGSNRKDWYLIGVCLDIDDRVLDTIRANEPDVRMQCTLMIQKWLRSNPSASWSDLCEALKELGEHTLAEQIFTQHCRSIQTSKASSIDPQPPKLDESSSQPQDMSSQPPTQHEPPRSCSTNQVVREIKAGPPLPSQCTAPMPSIPEANLDDLCETKKWDISVNFSTLFVDLVQLLDDAVDPEDLKLFLVGLYHLTTGEPYIKPEMYSACKSTKDILRALRPRFINVMHPFLLRDIFKRFGCGKAKELMEEYDATFPRSVPLDQLVDPLPDSLVAACRGSTTLTLLVEGHISTFTPVDLESFQTVFTRALGVKQVALVFSKHGPGNSVRLTFLIPDCILGAVIDLSMDRRKLMELSSSGILAIESDTCTIDLTEDPQYWKHAMMRRSFGEEWDMLSRGDSGLSSMNTSRSTSMADIGVLVDAYTKDDERAFAFAEKLHSNTTGKEARFQQAIISDVAAAQLADGLSDNHSLKHLQLNSCRISSEGISHFTSSLQTNKSLISLWFCFTELSDEGVDELAKSLNFNETLQKLHLWNCKITDRGVASLADCLYINSSLKTLDVNDVTDLGARSLSKALSMNETLTELVLRNCKITDRGVASLADCLYSNRSLKTLDVNDVTDCGASSLSEALHVNKTLTELILRNCKITDRGVASLADCLYKNRSLKTLDLNTIQNQGVRLLAESLAMNESLETLRLRVHGLTDTGAENLVIAIETNKSLRNLWLLGTHHFSSEMKQRMNNCAKKKGLDLHLIDIKSIDSW